eukprot:7791958-Ditylum_brightwellii.AAC.1
MPLRSFLCFQYRTRFALELFSDLFIHHLDDVAAVNRASTRFMPRHSSRARSHRGLGSAT